MLSFQKQILIFKEGQPRPNYNFDIVAITLPFYFNFGLDQHQSNFKLNLICFRLEDPCAPLGSVVAQSLQGSEGGG